MSASCEILSIVQTVIKYLNRDNVNIMSEKITRLRIRSEWLLQKITHIIHDGALNRPYNTHLYAQLCALIIKDKKFNAPLVNSNKTFLTLLVPKCRNLLYSYKTNTRIPTKKYQSNHEQSQILANCKFIGELFNQDIILEKTIRSIIDELKKETRNLQVHCLCSLLNSVGPKLAKTYNMTQIIEHLLSLKNKPSNKVMPSSLKMLINEIKYMHSKSWLHDDPDKIVQGTMISSPSKDINPQKVETPVDSDIILNEFTKNINPDILATIHITARKVLQYAGNGLENLVNKIVVRIRHYFWV